MPSRHFAPHILAIAALLGLSVLSVISFGEGFKILVVRRDGIKLLRRDGSTITFSLPWKSPTDDKSLSTSLTDAHLEDSDKLVSVEVSKGPNAVSILASILNEPNAFVDIVVSDSTNVGEGIVGATGTSGASNPSSFSFPSVFATMSNLLQQSTACSTCNNSFPTTAFKLNITSSALMTSSTALMASQTYMPSSCPPMTAFTSACPGPATVTCTVTETWHSTHYESTVTLFSFASIMTVTCTETVSVCPSSNLYIFPANSTIAASTSSPSSSSSIICANGAVVKGQADCLSSASSSLQGAISSVASILLNNSSSVVTTSLQSMASSIPSHPNAFPTTPNTPTPSTSSPSSITCKDGEVVMQTQDCLDGVSGTTSSLGAFQTSSISPSSASFDVTLIVSDISSVLANVPGLTGGLMTDVLAQVTSVIAIVNGALPTALSQAVDGVSAIAGDATAGVGGNNIIHDVPGVPNAAGNSLPMPGIQAEGGSDIVQAAGGVPNAAGNSLPTTGVSVASGNVNGVAEDGSGGSLNGIKAVSGDEAPSTNDIENLLRVLGGMIKNHKHKRDQAPLAERVFCEENPDDDSCYEKGGTGVWGQGRVKIEE